MWKRLARKPSTASLIPAATKRKKAARASPDVIAQTTIGTRMMRPNVMRFGILKRLPPALTPYYITLRLACAPGDSDVGGAEQSRRPGWWVIRQLVSP